MYGMCKCLLCETNCFTQPLTAKHMKTTHTAIYSMYGMCHIFCCRTFTYQCILCEKVCFLQPFPANTWKPNIQQLNQCMECENFSVVGNLCIIVHCVKKLFSWTISSRAPQNCTCNTIQVVHELYLSMYIVWKKLFSWTISSKAQQNGTCNTIQVVHELFVTKYLKQSCVHSWNILSLQLLKEGMLYNDMFLADFYYQQVCRLTYKRLFLVKTGVNLTLFWIRMNRDKLYGWLTKTSMLLTNQSNLTLL